MSNNKPEKAIGPLLLARGLKLGTAESCTGGLIGHLLTEVPGISAVLDRAVVSYSNQAKIDTLGVPAALIEKHGAVSAEVAEAMALGVRERAGTDLGLSTTGIAGPGGGSEEKPVGLVYFGLAGPGLEGPLLAAADAVADAGGADAGAVDSGGDGRAETVRMVFRGSRSVIKLKAAVHGLDLVRCRLLGIQGEAGA
jgi:PncC family amidohydrolase